MNLSASLIDHVGPVLARGGTADAVLAAIEELNPGVVVADAGAYRRVLAPGRCVLTREAVERRLGRSFRLPGELEAVMPSFKGELEISEERATWKFGGRRP